MIMKLGEKIKRPGSNGAVEPVKERRYVDE
jgi:hypothetical protein